ncbi:MAG: class I SAM-dependent methyltransferase [Candidatus Bathyarchaeia archaeon]|jgi:predicted O-methyltransferase YrrM
MVQYGKYVIYMMHDYPLVYEFLGRTAGSVLGRRAQGCVKTEELISVISNVFAPLKPLGWTISLQQVKREIVTLLAIVRKKNVHSMMEIGTRNGGTLFLFSWTLPSDAKIISLDLPSAESLKRGYDRFKTSYLSSFIQKGQQLTLLRGDSHRPSSLANAKSTLKGEKVDFLFIDGDHTYEGVKKDFEMYSTLVRRGGLIAFHDICGHDVGISEVDRFWYEIKTGYDHSEIIEDQKQNWAGIGLLYV